MAESARVVVEVQAGLVPGHPEAEHTRRWGLTSDEWQSAMDSQRAGAVLAELNGRAQGYAGMLMLQPDRLNWVRVDWLWL